jgi:hypothetical protein
VPRFRLIVESLGYGVKETQQISKVEEQGSSVKYTMKERFKNVAMKAMKIEESSSVANESVSTPDIEEPPVPSFTTAAFFKGLSLFRSCLTHSVPGSTPKPEIVAAFFVLVAPLLLRAVYVFELCLYVHHCNMESPSIVPYKKVSTSSYHKFSFDHTRIPIKKESGTHFFNWAVYIAKKLELMHKNDKLDVIPEGEVEQKKNEISSLTLLMTHLMLELTIFAQDTLPQMIWKSNPLQPLQHKMSHQQRQRRNFILLLFNFSFRNHIKFVIFMH